MKIPIFILAPAIGFALLLTPAYAEDPAPTALPPEMQALFAELLKSLAQQASATEARPLPEPEPAAPAQIPPMQVTRSAKSPLGSNGSLSTGGLVSGGLTSGGLAPSGRGGASMITRLSNNEWRQLFPLRDDRR